jgi:PAS domain S-box-containing protein
MIIKGLKRFISFVLAENESFSLENRLFLSTLVIGITTSFLGTLVSIALSSSLTTIIVAASLFFLLLILFYFVRFKRMFKPFTVPLIIISFSGISIIWIFDGGINGSDLLVAFAILILGLIIVPARTRKYILALFLAFLIIIYLIQLFRPDLITGFKSEKVRWTDSIVTAIYSSFFIFLIIGFLLKNYIMEKQRAEENEIKFRALSENSQDCIARFDRQHRYTYINKAGIEVMGISKGHIIGKNPAETGIYDDKQRQILIGTIEKVFVTKEPQFEQFSLKRVNGTAYYDLRLFPEYNDKNEVVSILGVSRDITILKQSEIKLLQLNADKDLFISIMAHDLRNPFNSILGLSDLLLEDIQNMDRLTIEKYIDLIHSISHKTFNLLEDLLLWTKSQSGKLEFKPVMIDFVKTCLETVDQMRTNALSKNITISCSLSGRIPLLADEDMLKVVLRNLVSNAIKFTYPDGKIDVFSEQSESMLTVTVSDNGVGIPEGRINDLFDISKIITTPGTSDEKGTGLGLLLCKEFVEKHSGTIWVESTEGKGSNFKFTLPIGNPS